MSVAPSSPAKHAFRIASLVAPSWLAWYVACSAPHRDELTRTVAALLGPPWVVVAVALVVRSAAIVVLRRREPPASILARIDVLGSNGSALAWLSAFALMGAVWAGWASLAVVGLLGTGLFYAAVLFAFVALRGPDPIRAASITRRFTPAVVIEGDRLVEEIHLAGARIPLGFRLFLAGRIGPRWATSRHVVEASASGAEVVLRSDVGPAVRGACDAEPLVAWLEDGFGICRSMRLLVAPESLTVLPRLRAVERVAPLLDRGSGPRAPRTATRLPTDGCLDLREYRPGDDARRIHWVRSLAAGDLVVRLPDELPPDRPRVRVVLDTFFPEAGVLSCDAPSEMLDSLVAVWIAVGRALAESGARVTLVTALPKDEEIAAVRHELSLREPGAAQRIGASVVWQDRVAVHELFTDEATFVIARGLAAAPPDDPRFRWIVVVPDVAPELALPFPSSARLALPMGAPEDRWQARRRRIDRLARTRAHHARAVLLLHGSPARPPSGSFAAIAKKGAGAIRLEAIR